MYSNFTIPTNRFKVNRNGIAAASLNLLQTNAYAPRASLTGYSL